MSNLDVNLGNMPNFGSSREADQYLQGKPTRAEMMSDMQKMWEKLLELVHGQAQYSSGTIGRIGHMARLNGLQLDTMVRLIEKAVPDFEKNFKLEFQKTLDFVAFLDTINPPGEHSEKPIRERIDIVRAWNSVPEHELKAKSEHFGLSRYIMQNPTEFTAEEVEALNVEFSMDAVVPTKEAVNAEG